MKILVMKSGRLLSFHRQPITTTFKAQKGVKDIIKLTRETGDLTSGLLSNTSALFY